MKHLKHLLTLSLVLFSAMAFSQTSIPVTNTTTLDASLSSDQDGTIASYQWTKISGPAGGDIITNSASIKATVVYTVPGTYSYQLKVTDNKFAVGYDTTTRFVLPANIAPKANAGGSQTIQLPTGTTTMSADIKDERIFYASGTVPKKYDK